MRVGKIIILLFPVLLQAQTFTSENQIDSLFVVLEAQKQIRLIQSNPNSGASKQIYSKEVFKYRFIDSLEVDIPIFANSPGDSIKEVKMTNLIDSMKDSSSTIPGFRARALKWLTKPGMKQRTKQRRRVGVIAYTSRDSLLAVVEWFKYMPLTKRKLTAGIWNQPLSSIFIGHKVGSISEFNSLLQNLRSNYFESHIN